MCSEIVTSNQKSRKYRSFLLQLGENLKNDDLKRIKFVLKDEISARKLEQIHQPCELFTSLEEQGLLGPDKLDELCEYLEAIHRPKLTEMVEEFHDADTKYPLKQRAENCLKKDGFSVSVKNGRHFETSQGEYVEVRSGSTYALTLSNENNIRCLVKFKIDGYDMFPNSFTLGPRTTFTFQRPEREKKKFKFFAIRDAPQESGINKWRKDKNGLIEITFTPERADMKITCVAAGSGTQTVSCSNEILDTEFLEIVSEVFNDAVVTVMLPGCKPLAKRGIKLIEYGVRDGFRVYVTVGGIGGRNFFLAIPSEKVKKKDWRAGATTLEDESDQEFVDARGYPTNPSLAVTLSLRLVARENEIPLPSTGNPTPLLKATLIPPPVPN